MLTAEKSFHNAFAPSSLRARVTLGFTVAFAVFVVVVCAFFYVWRWYRAKQDAAQQVRAAVLLIQHEWDGNTTSQGIEVAIEDARKDALQHGWLTALDNVAVMIVDDTGHVLGANRYPHPPWQAALRSGWLTAEARTANATIVAGVNWRVIEAALRGEILLLLGFGSLVTVIAGISAWILVGRTLRPIGALADQADVASADPLHIQLSPSSKDGEVLHLVGTLNGFLDRMRETARTREQFYAATAHELRSPLSVLSGSIEVALSRPRDNVEYRETLTDLHHQTQRLIALVEGLLLLNRLHTDSDAEDAEIIDLADICQRTLATFAPLAYKRDLQIQTNLANAPDVSAPGMHLTVLVRNVIENAVKYADLGGTVSVSLRSVHGGVQLDVFNAYNSSARWNIEQWFEPFYRADSARSRTSVGNGLGLAICRRISDAYNWNIIANQEPGGVRVIVTVPSAH